MNNYSQPGDVVTVTAPADVQSDDVVQVGQIVGIACHDALSGQAVEIARRGVFTGLPKEAGTAYTVGALIHWNGTAFSAAATIAGDLIVGYAAAAAASGDTTGSVLLDGTARADV